jgi:hypothetical protein
MVTFPFPHRPVPISIALPADPINSELENKGPGSGRWELRIGINLGGPLELVAATMPVAPPAKTTTPATIPNASRRPTLRPGADDGDVFESRTPVMIDIVAG